MRESCGDNHLELIYVGAEEDGFNLIVHADNGGRAFEELCLPPGGHLDRLALSLAIMLRIVESRTFSGEGSKGGEGEERGGAPSKWGSIFATHGANMVPHPPSTLLGNQAAFTTPEPIAPRVYALPFYWDTCNFAACACKCFDDAHVPGGKLPPHGDVYLVGVCILVYVDGACRCKGGRTLRMTNLQVGPSPLISLPMDARAAAAAAIVIRASREKEMPGCGRRRPPHRDKKWQHGENKQAAGSARGRPADVLLG